MQRKLESDLRCDSFQLLWLAPTAPSSTPLASGRRRRLIQMSEEKRGGVAVAMAVVIKWNDDIPSTGNNTVWTAIQESEDEHS